TVLALDQDTADAAGHPAIAPLDAGVAYLRTLAPPPLLGSERRMWSLGDVAVLSAPGGAPVVHIGLNFPLALLGDARWADGILWYHLHWEAPKHEGDGWLPAIAVTFRTPGAAPAWAGFDVLSPALQSYLAGWGTKVAAVAYDETRGRYYTYNPTGRFTM